MQVGVLVGLILALFLALLRQAPEGDVKSVEPGMDIFRRQPDGSWKIMRYMAYSREP